MTDEFILYTVTSSRAPFYAIVEPGTGRVWTAPTKDGAIRQARDAGVTEFKERTTSREAFLRSLGIADDAPPRPKSEPHVSEPPPHKSEPPSSGNWFVPGAGAANEGASASDFSIPRSFRTGKKKAWPATGANPFAPIPISAPEKPFELATDEEDVLILPSAQRQDSKASPFTDAAPPTPLVPDDDTL